MIANIYRELYSKLKELTWMKHIALNTNQLTSSEKNGVWNTPAVFISFETQEVNQLGNGTYQVVNNITFQFVMKDFNKDQLLCLDYSVMLEKKLNNFLGLRKVMNNYIIDQELNYVYESVFQIIYNENLNSCEDNQEVLLEDVNLGLWNVQTLEDTDGQGFAKDGIDI